jgi:uncharacterized repeat protein (TIGR02543 family)
LFINWSGDCSGSNTATGVTLDSDKTCVANVVPILTVVVAGKGGGTVSDSLGGITDCQAQCSEPVSLGTVVGLSAKIAAAGYSFAGWSDDCAGSLDVTTVTMDAPKTCTATFTPLSYTFTVEVANGTGGTIYYGPPNGCTSTCAEPVQFGQGFKLLAESQRGYTFQGWSGDCTGTQPETAVMIQGDTTCTATFAPLPDAGMSSDGGGGAEAAPPQCNSLGNKGPVVNVVNAASDPPVYQGGPIFPGTYMLMGATTYTGPSGASGPTGDTIQETFVYFGSPASGQIQGVISVDGAGDASFNGMLTLSGPSTLAIDYTCGPLTSSQQLAFTSTPVELRVYDDSLKTEWLYMKP